MSFVWVESIFVPIRQFEKSVKKNLGQNPLPGIEIDYFIPKGFDTLDVKISILKNEVVIRKFENKKDTIKFKTWQGGPSEKKYLKPKYGFNRFKLNAPYNNDYTTKFTYCCRH